MKKPKYTNTDRELQLLIQELHENPFSKLSSSFSLMTVIPLLIFFYILVVRLSSVNILTGNIGFMLFLSIALSLYGYYVAYNVIKKLLNKVVDYAALAKHRDRIKSEFIVFVSHELKTPLSVIKVNLSNLNLGLLGDVSREQKEVIATCHNMIDRMNRLIVELLDLYKIEMGMVRLERRMCNLTDIVEKQLHEFKELLSKNHIKLIKHIENRELNIFADGSKVTEVVNNLLSNATKFTAKDGTITLRMNLSDSFAKLEITDTGAGIPRDKLIKIFDKFERVDLSKEGVGLGLAITKDIVELHSGRIWVDSKMGRGSTFTVLFPRFQHEMEE